MTTRICPNCTTELEPGFSGDLCPNCQFKVNHLNAAVALAPASPAGEQGAPGPLTLWPRIVANRKLSVAGLAIGMLFPLAVILTWWMILKKGEPPPTKVGLNSSSAPLANTSGDNGVLELTVRYPGL